MNGATLFKWTFTLLYFTLLYLTLLYFTLLYFTLLYFTLPYLTLPYLILPYLTLPYLTLPYLTLPYLTLPSLPYLTLPYLTLPYLTLLYFTLLYFTLEKQISGIPQRTTERGRSSHNSNRPRPISQSFDSFVVVVAVVAVLLLELQETLWKTKLCFWNIFVQYYWPNKWLSYHQRIALGGFRYQPILIIWNPCQRRKSLAIRSVTFICHFWVHLQRRYVFFLL